MTPVDAFALRQASCRARLLAASGGFRRDEWEDLRQEMLLDLLRRVPKFDATRGDWQGFVRGVTRNHSTVLVTRHRRRAREVLGEDLVDREESGGGDPMATLQKHRCSYAVAELNLRLDVHRVVAGLPPRLRRLALLLAQMPVKDVCERMGKSRSRVYQMTLQIREAFVGAGLAPCYSRVRIDRKSLSRRSSVRGKKGVVQ